MDRWKAEMGRVREKKRRRKKIKEEKVRSKKIQVREKVGKSRNTVFSWWFVAPEGRKVGSLKRRVRSQLARWEMKNCTQLWRDTHFEVNSVKKLTVSDQFWKLRCRKKCTPLWRKVHFQVKCTKRLQLQLRYTTLYSTTLHYNSTTLHYTTLFTLHYTTPHYTTLH